MHPSILGIINFIGRPYGNVDMRCHPKHPRSARSLADRLGELGNNDDEVNDDIDLPDRAPHYKSARASSNVSCECGIEFARRWDMQSWGIKHGPEWSSLLSLSLGSAVEVDWSVEASRLSWHAAYLWAPADCIFIIFFHPTTTARRLCQLFA